MAGDRVDHFFGDHPPFGVFFFEPGVRELDGDGLESAGWDLLEEAVEPEHGVAEGVVQVGEAGFGGEAVGFVDEGFADLDAEVVSRRFGFGHTEEKAAAGAADVE